MPGRDLGEPVTVINRFKVKGDTAKFERSFREHSQFLRRRRGFDFLVTVRLVDRPHVYVHLGYWRTLQAFLDTVHDGTFAAHVRQLTSMVETEADQAVSLGRVHREKAVVGAENVVLVRARVHGDRRAFEERFAGINDHCARLGGFGGSDLLHSTLRSPLYTGVQWWRDTESCDRALRSGRYRRSLEALAGDAWITVERTRHVACERTAD